LSVICCLISLFSIYVTFKLLSRDYKPTIPEVASIEVQRAMMRMGPNYNYRMLCDGTLQVNKGDGKWRRLNYSGTQ